MLKTIIKNILLIQILIITTSAEIYVRYNVLGYNPSRNKRLIVMSDDDLFGQKWSLKNSTSKNGKKILSGKFNASKCGIGDHTPLPYNYYIYFTNVKDEGEYIFETKGKSQGNIKIKKDPYSWIIEKPLHWMRAARCGSYDCVDHKPCHFADSSCLIHRRKGILNNIWNPDSSGKRVSLSGGWHDAGDYIKVTLTTAYATYFLLRSYEVNPDIFTKKLSKTNLVDILDEAKWGLDYLQKLMPDTNEFIIQVGAYADHNCGLRLPHEDQLALKREALSALSPTQMGLSAAALAVGSIVFEKLKMVEDANKYRKTAELFYRRAISKDAVTPAWFAELFNWYDDITKDDNLELAASELYRLTKDKKYFEHAKKFSDKTRAAGWRGWDHINMPAHLSLMEHYSVVKNDLFIDLENFMSYTKRKGNVWGLPVKYVWGGLYVYIGIASSAMEYQLRSKSRKYDKLGYYIIDYMFGVNNWGISFVAAKELEYCIKYPYSQIYTLQSHLFPEGAISEGPGDKHSYIKDHIWFGYDSKAQPTHKFNTNKGVFYDHVKDFMCMETTIGGVSDGIYLLALASKLYNE